MIKNLAYLSAFTTFVVLVWISISIYNNINSSTVTKSESTQIAPLAPTFNTTVLSSLKNRIQVPVDLSAQIVSSGSAQNTQARTPSTTATPTLTPNPSQIAPSPTPSQSYLNATNSASQKL